MTYSEYKQAQSQGVRLLKAVIKAEPKTTAERNAQAAYAAWYERVKGNRKLVVNVMRAAGCREAEFA